VARTKTAPDWRGRSEGAAVAEEARIAADIPTPTAIDEVNRIFEMVIIVWRFLLMSLLLHPAEITLAAAISVLRSEDA
jgi:hypothetical protein